MSSINWDEIDNYKPKRDFMYYFRKWIIKPLSTAKYWLRAHTYNRYHILDMRTPEYDWGWCDRDYLILAASFNILKAFVEEEYHGKFTLEVPENDKGTDMEDYWIERCKFELEVKELYDWWTKGRWGEKKTLDDAEDFTYDDMLSLDIIDNANLIRLMNIREYLWT